MHEIKRGVVVTIVSKLGSLRQTKGSSRSWLDLDFCVGIFYQATSGKDQGKSVAQADFNRRLGNCYLVYIVVTLAKDEVYLYYNSYSLILASLEAKIRLIRVEIVNLED